MTARYVCFEGTEGVGKTTQTQKLVDYLRARGYKVLQTKEPGTPLSPLTMELRNIMLNAKYDKEMTVLAREYVSQAIRSIHINNVIAPALEEYDFIVQDRGILSGLAYGQGCGNSLHHMEGLAYDVMEHSRIKATNQYDEIHGGYRSPFNLYDDVIYLTGDAANGLNKAKQTKQEFEAGDAIEAKGASFMQTVAENMDKQSQRFNTHKIPVDGKTIDEVFEGILSALKVL